MANMQTSIGDFKLKNPFICASGVWGVSAASMQCVLDAGFAAIVAKSVMLEPRMGNEMPVFVKLPYGTLNRMGLPGPGVDDMIKEIKLLGPDCWDKVIPSVSEESTEKYIKAVLKFIDAGARVVEVNVSCPNVEHEIDFWADALLLEGLVRALRTAVGHRAQLWIKLSPNVAYIGKIAQGAEKGGADALVVGNTCAGMDLDLDSGHPLLGPREVPYCGYGGSAILPIALANVHKVHKAVRIPIIGVGGITDADAAFKHIMVGARAVECASLLAELSPEEAYNYLSKGVQFWLDKKQLDLDACVALAHGSTGPCTCSDRPEPEKSTMCKILEVEELNPTVKLITFEYPYNSATAPTPEIGQYYMLWLPGIGQVPMSIAEIDTCFGNLSFAVRRVGEMTKALHALKAGDMLGLQGPLGNGYRIVSSDLRRRLVVAGGCGIASLMPIITHSCGHCTVFYGAKTSEDLFFLEQIEGHIGKDNLVIVTDDGTAGEQGLVCDYALRYMREYPEGLPFEVYTCGPELMMLPLIQYCLRIKIDIQASLERYVKCGQGACDSCAIGPYHVCKDGPVFHNSTLAKMLDEVGQFKRNAAGQRVSFTQPQC